jgi:hypothetical protein
VKGFEETEISHEGGNVLCFDTTLSGSIPLSVLATAFSVLTLVPDISFIIPAFAVLMLVTAVAPLVSITALVAAMLLSLKTSLLLLLLALLSIINGNRKQKLVEMHQPQEIVPCLEGLLRKCLRFKPVQQNTHLELDYRFGSAKSLNFELDPGPGGFRFEPRFRTEPWQH